jgi:hypothetical protein
MGRINQRIIKRVTINKTGKAEEIDTTQQQSNKIKSCCHCLGSF